MANNIYSKLQKAKHTITGDLKKGKKNEFSGYKYFELKDFLPQTIAAFDSEGLCSYFNFYEDRAELIIVNSENPEEKIVTTSPMRSVTLKGAHDIQNLGAVQTYLRRYLYLALLDITEGEKIDLVHDEAEKITREQLRAVLKKKKMGKDEVKKFIEQNLPQEFNIEFDRYTYEMLEKLLEELQK